ncbi:tuberin-like [Centruroides sculpturatus]|uniref:tuberin-like n=1 Tax=Centruroides sculpturatus TaxID=218467 RepID=UPI000C6EC0C9|nr:tuberin-like [Centruroides sculpturatus]
MAKPISKDKTLQEKFKQFFGFNKGASQQPEHFPKIEKIVLDHEILKEIERDSPLSQRVKTIKELQNIIQNKHLHEGSVEALCSRTLDMQHSSQPTEVRHTILYFYCNMIKSQFNQLTTMRDYFFRLIKDHKIPDDLLPRIEMLKALSDNGKQIEYFEEDAGPFLLEWMPEIISGNRVQEFLPLLVNMIKCNAAYLDEDIIAGIVNYTCTLCERTNSEDDVQLCLQVLDAVICYSYPPSNIIPSVITTLSRTVNLEKFCQVSWKLMRNLLGTCLGHYSIYTMCKALQDISNYDDPTLLRGTIFFVSMSLWGNKRVQSLENTMSAVLPSFLMVLDCPNDIVAYEVMLGIQRLLEHSSKELLGMTWDLILEIINKLQAHSENLPSNISSRLSVNVHDLITTIEQLHDAGIYKGSVDRLFEIIEKSPHIPEQSVLRLIDYKTQFLHSSQENWLNNINQLMMKYFRNEKRTIIRSKVLSVLSHVFITNRYLYEDELIENIVLPFLSHLELDPDIIIRTDAVHLLVKIIQDCSSKKCLDLLDIIEKVIRKAFDQFHLVGTKDPSDTVLVINEDEITDVKTAIIGLIETFKFLESNINCFINNTVIRHMHMYRLYKIMQFEILHIVLIRLPQLYVNFVEDQYMSIFAIALPYTNPKFDQYTVALAHRVIAMWFLKCRIPFRRDFASFITKYIKFYICLKKFDFRDQQIDLTNESISSPLLSTKSSSFSTLSFSYLDLSEAFQVIITCLKQEKDWTVLELVLQKLPELLQNKAAVIGGLNSVNALCSNLCAMISDRNLCLPESLRNTPPRLTRADFQSCVLPVIAALAAYHNEMALHIQRLMINCLQSVLVTKCARNSITALIQCTLEMQETMCKLLPGVLLSLSKISATVSIAVPVLEFLSSKLIHYECTRHFLNESQSTPEPTQVLSTQLLETCMDLMARFTFGMCSNHPKRSSVAEFLLENGQTASWLVGNKIVTITTSGCGTKAFKNGLCEKCYALCKNVLDDESENETTKSIVEQSTRRRHRSAVNQTTNTEINYNFSRTKDDLLLHRQLPEGRLMESLTSISELKSSSSKVILTSSSVKSSENTSIIKPIDDLTPDSKEEKLKNAKCSSGNLCSCWCNGWAEIFIRRPTGNTSWMFRIQNRLFLPNCPPDLNLPDISTLLLPHKTNRDLNIEDKCDSEVDDSSYYDYQHLSMLPSDPLEDIAEQVPSTNSEIDTDHSESSESHSNVSHQRSNSPLRRTNSSPEMKGEWNICSNSNLKSSEDGTQTKSENTSQTNEDSVYSENVSDSNESREMAPKVIETGLGEQQTKSVIRKSPRKEDKCISISEESKPPKAIPSSPRKEESRLKLRLDLSNVSGSASSELKSSASPPLPHSASPQLAVRKTKSSPTSPPGKTAGPRSPPPTNYYRDRGHTISVMSPVHSKKLLQSSNKVSSSYREMYRSGLSPSFVFLQLYHSATFGTASDKPVLLPKTEVINRAIKMIDHTPAYETHKIGVIYIGPGQANQESVILRNEGGSIRYTEFLHGLGTVVQISEVDQRKVYLGGLDSKADGKFAYIWHDDLIQIVFHVATMMPNKEIDPAGNMKKLHIANDFVTIVYNESGEDYSLGTIKSQLTSACVIICPEDFGLNVVTVKLKSEITEFGHLEPHIVSDESLPIFVRQLAVHANLISMITVYKEGNLDPYFSTWLERLRKIKQLHVKARQETSTEECYIDSSGGLECARHLEDFTDYV